MAKVRIVIQSRLSSSRLPGKALLPVAGMPSVVLCALRAAVTGIETVVATSVDTSDDLIVKALTEVGIRFFRGPLDDVLGRYELATSDLEPGSIVVRMTADNLLPDGSLVREMVSFLVNKGLNYLGTNDRRLPYGLAAEVFTVDVLREASRSATKPYDREHVTPWIRNKYNEGVFKSDRLGRDFSNLRCTMDTFEDYLRVVKVFQDIQDPVQVSWVDLCLKLAALEEESGFKLPQRKKNGFESSELTLGTAQLGMEYGIANRSGKPSPEAAIKLIHAAIGYGVNSIDTARAYGEAEERVGESLKGGYAGKVRVITKLDPLEWLKGDQTPKSVMTAVDASVYRSCRNLGLRQLPVLLLHRWGHRYACQEMVWRRLLQLKADGVIQVLGASAQTPEEALEAIEEPEIGHIQLPFNILDWRWCKSGVDQALSQRKDLTVHVRSVFLQGILTSDLSIWPKVRDLDAVKLIKAIDDIGDDLGRENRADLCIAYVRAQQWVDSLVIGMETIEQLEGNIKCFMNKPLTGAECKLVETKLGKVPVELLNPVFWK
jgi:spore coat polysaccharide biosynthesis protein SpsF (cytidylyltransferase family)/aryl-alcohol dehydrogenase-like predicted oxidoreductase